MPFTFFCVISLEKFVGSVKCLLQQNKTCPLFRHLIEKYITFFSLQSISSYVRFGTIKQDGKRIIGPLMCLFKIILSYMSCGQKTSRKHHVKQLISKETKYLYFTYLSQNKILVMVSLHFVFLCFQEHLSVAEGSSRLVSQPKFLFTVIAVQACMSSLRPE